MKTIARLSSGWVRLAPYLRSVTRVVVGLMLLEYGLAKVFNFPVSISKGEPLPPIIYFSGLIELVGGLFLLTGVLTRYTSFFVSGEMAVVYWSYFAPRGPLPASSGGDLAITWCFLLLYMSCAGGGPVSVDALVERLRPKLRKSPIRQP